MKYDSWRKSILFVVILVVTNAATALFFTHHGFAELTFKNVSADTIKTVWLHHSSLELREHDIKRGDQKSIRFHMDERDPDHTCQIVFSGGNIEMPTCEVVIGNGERHTLYVYQDRIESDILKRSTP